MKDWQKFLTIEQASQVVGLSAERLENLATSGHAPHYYCDGLGPLFQKTELKQWISDNLVQARGGMPMPRELPVLCPIDRTNTKQIPPTPLLGLMGLAMLSIPPNISGVYFLCDGDDVVYVGQSVQVVNRIATHLAEGRKKFDADRVFFMPCPPPDLNAVEGQFIRLLNPKYNGNNGDYKR